MTRWTTWCRLARLRAAGEAGMVTVETAMVLPLLVLFALVGVSMIGLAQARLRCADAAEQAARQLARGDPAEAARLASAVAGRPVLLSSSQHGPDTVVTLHAELRPVHWLAAVAISESATVATEPTMAAEPAASVQPAVVLQPAVVVEPAAVAGRVRVTDLAAPP